MELLTRVPRSLRIAVIVVLAFLICGALYTFKIREIGKLKAEINRVEAEEAELSHPQVTFQPPAEEEREEWEKAEERLWLVIFPEKDVPQLIEELAKVAKEYNISDISFSTGPVVAEGGRRVSPSLSNDVSVEGLLPAEKDHFAVKVSLRCQYRQLARFLDGITDLVRLVEIESLEVKRGLPRISVDMVVKTYYSKKGSHAQK